MKKKLLTLMLVLMASTTLFAQLRHEQQSQIGIRAGATFSTLDDGIDRPQGFNDPWVPRFNIGLATSFWSARNEWLSFSPEVNYTQRGHMVEIRDDARNESYTYRYSFAEIPLLFRATFGREILRGYVNAGPAVSYLIGGKEITEINGVRTEISIGSEDERYNYFELAGAFGGGLHINTGIGSFLIDFRYHRSFTNMYTDDYVLPAYGSLPVAPSDYNSQYVSTSLIFLGPYRK